MELRPKSAPIRVPHLSVFLEPSLKNKITVTPSFGEVPYEPKTTWTIGCAVTRDSVSLTEWPISAKSPKNIAMNIREKDTILSFNVSNQPKHIYSISDGQIWYFSQYLILFNNKGNNLGAL